MMKTQASSACILIHNTGALCNSIHIFLLLHSGSDSKDLFVMQEVQSQGREDPLEKGTGTHSSIPAWRILWTEEPGLQSMGLQRTGHD